MENSIESATRYAVHCRGCLYNPGKCSICSGNGIFKTSGGALDCKHCKGTGICPGCNGSGWVTIPVYISNSNLA